MVSAKFAGKMEQPSETSFVTVDVSHICHNENDMQHIRPGTVVFGPTTAYDDRRPNYIKPRKRSRSGTTTFASVFPLECYSESVSITGTPYNNVKQINETTVVDKDTDTPHLVADCDKGEKLLFDTRMQAQVFGVWGDDPPMFGTRFSAVVVGGKCNVEIDKDDFPDDEPCFPGTSLGYDRQTAKVKKWQEGYIYLGLVLSVPFSVESTGGQKMLVPTLLQVKSHATRPPPEQSEAAKRFVEKLIAFGFLNRRGQAAFVAAVSSIINHIPQSETVRYNENRADVDRLEQLRSVCAPVSRSLARIDDPNELMDHTDKVAEIVFPNLRPDPLTELGTLPLGWSTPDLSAFTSRSINLQDARLYSILTLRASMLLEI